MEKIYINHKHVVAPQLYPESNIQIDTAFWTPLGRQNKISGARNLHPRSSKSLEKAWLQESQESFPNQRHQSLANRT